MKRWIPMFAGVLAAGCTFYRPMNVTLEPVGPKEEAVAVVKGDVPIDDRGSPYAFVGDWVPATAWGILIGLHFYSKARRRSITPPAAATP